MRRTGIKGILLLFLLLFTAPLCFASDYAFTLDESGVPALGGERSVIVVISDIHLGMDDRYAEIQRNRAPLADFLRKVRCAPNIKELVVAGDLVDEWFIPAGTDTYAGKTQKEFVQRG